MTPASIATEQLKNTAWNSQSPEKVLVQFISAITGLLETEATKRLSGRRPERLERKQTQRRAANFLTITTDNHSPTTQSAPLSSEVGRFVRKIRKVHAILGLAVKKFLFNDGAQSAGAVLFGMAVPVLIRMTRGWLFPMHDFRSWVYDLGSFFIPLVVVFFGLCLIYRLTPSRPTRFAEVWAAALCTTVLLRVGESLFVIYLQDIATLNAVYGAFGGVMALLLWINVSGCVFIYGKHHKAYVDNLNNVVMETEFADLPLVKFITGTAGRHENTAIFNNAAQIWDHSFY